MWPCGSKLRSPGSLYETVLGGTEEGRNVGALRTIALPKQLLEMMSLRAPGKSERKLAWGSSRPQGKGASAN